ncbi:MAG: 4-(cytidine 5'-diphospho)-2-C-methyl-D-erythritol kinase, partial [Vallitaleaceae bacterium]|nr:4-(cytidine 5'-diphospho)-2-C-methyl-D-erythritol kinase [Vallitaleaceae bacterium]
IPSGVQVDLFKMIPIAAGLAGGSSDAAATIIGMNRLFRLNLNRETMLSIGEQFGSDIAFCMIQGTALATGLGEKITLLDDFPMMKVLLAKPNFGVSTADVYKNFDLQKQMHHPDTQGLMDAIKRQDQDFICSHLANVLEEVTIHMKPSIQRIKNEMKELGADGVLMSGSGPTVYGLFQDETIAKKACKQMKNNKELQFVYLTEIYNRRKG